MRKSMVCAVLVMMLMLTLAFALAEAPASVFTLVRVTEAGETVVGTAVSADRTGATLISAGCAAQEGLYAVRGGERIAVTGASPDELGLGLSVLTLSAPVQGEAAAFSTGSAAVWYGVKADGGELRGEASAPVTTVIAGREILSVRLASGVMPGAVLFDADGSIAGLAVSGANEGFDRWNVVSGADLYELLVGMTYALRTPSPTAIPTAAPSLTVTETEPGLIRVELQGAEGDWTFYVSDSVNTYYATMTSELMVPVPGHTYLLWAMPSEIPFNESVAIQDYPCALYTQPDPGACTMYGFHDTEAYLTVAGADESFGETEIIPGKPLTLSALRDGQNVWLQVNSVYDVTEQDEYIMLAVLTAPDGQCFEAASGFLFMPEYMYADSWHWNVTDLFTDCARLHGSELPGAGTYTFSYYIGGSLASTFTVELTDDLQPAPEAEEVIRVENGLTLIDLSKIGAKDGEKWRVFYGDNANSYYLWKDCAGTCASLILQPGRTYAFTAARWEDEASAPSAGEAQYIGEITQPDGQPFTDHHFTDLGSYAALTDGTTEITSGLILENNGPSFPAEALTSGCRLHLQVRSSYEIEGEEEHPSLVTLFFPDGNTSSMESAYVFSAEYMPEDSWSMDITDILLMEMTEWLYGGEIPCGEYRLCYTASGLTIADVTFTLTDDPYEVPEEIPATPSQITEEPAAEVEDLIAVLERVFTVTTENGVTRADWSGIASAQGLPAELTAMPAWRISFRYTESDRGYSTVPGGTSAELYLVPGRECELYLIGIAQDGEETPVCARRFVTPENGSFTDYGYYDELLYVTLSDRAMTNGASRIPEVDTISTGLIRGGSCVVLQAASHYTVSEMTDAAMCVCLTAPNGAFYSMMAGFTFAPGIETDQWNWNVTELFTAATQDGNLVPGAWTLSYYLAGQLAGTVSFLVE